MITLAATNTIRAVAGTGSAITYTLFGLEFASAVDTYKVLAQGQVASSVGTIYTAPASTQSFVRQITLANTTSSAVSGVILYVNGTAATNQISGSFTIPANGSAVLDDKGWTVYDSLGNLFYSYTNLFDNTAVANTTPLIKSTAGSATTMAHRDHTHLSPGGMTSTNATFNSAAEVQLVGLTFPANSINAGTAVRFKAMCVGTNTSSTESLIFKLRIGHASLTGTQIVTVTLSTIASATNQPITVFGFATFRTTGVAGTCGGEIAIYGTNASTGLVTILNSISSNVSMNIAWDSTITNVVELTITHGNVSNSVIVENAVMELVKI